MANYLSPLCNEQQSDSNGAPLSGGKVFTYQAGTSTLAATYTEDGVAQANPVVLNSSGLPDNAIWLQGGTSYKFVIKNSSDVTQRTVDDITGINDPDASGAVTEWTVYTGSPTYIGATSFSVAGDQTNVFQVLRRVRTTNTGGTVYSRISATSYNSGTGLTTVTVVNDSGSLDSGLSAVAYGLLSATNPSIPETTIGKALRVAATVADAKSATPIQAGTVQATTSGTLIDFSSIPSWVKRVTISFAGLSTSGTSLPIIQLGDSGGIEATGYLGGNVVNQNASNGAGANATTGFLLVGSVAAVSVAHGIATLALLDSTANTWGFSVAGGFSNAANAFAGGGSKSLSATLDRIRLTTVNGTDTFDAGSVNILYE